MKKTIVIIPILSLVAAAALFMSNTGISAEKSRKATTMTSNKQTVQKYMEAFNKSDHAAVLSCLRDDVEWVIPGVFHIKGKPSFDKEVENPAFVGSPTIKVTRMTEERDVVVAEGN